MGLFFSRVSAAFRTCVRHVPASTGAIMGAWLLAATACNCIGLWGQQPAPAPQDRTASLTAAWQPMGPNAVTSATYGKLSGRILAIALDPNDASGNTVYLGTAGGGVWKSTNAAGLVAGATFTPLTDTLPVFSPNSGTAALPSLSIGALAVQPSSNPVVLAGTGNPLDASGPGGAGLLRSTDGGLTWSLVQTSRDGSTGNHSLVGLSASALAWSTALPTTVVAAFAASSANNFSTAGLYYSTDAGQTWHMSTLLDGSTAVQRPQIGTQTGNDAMAVVWNAQRGRFFAAVRAHGYYSSPDGVTWTRLGAQPGTALTAANCPASSGASTCPLFRGALTVQPATGDMYALTVDANGGDQGLWQDLCHVTPQGACSTATPTFAARLDGGAFEPESGNAAIPGSASTLTLAAVAVANNGTLLFAGMADLFRCALDANASACTFRNTTNASNTCATPAGVAPAQHALATTSQASGSSLLLAGNDGGLWRSLDGVAQTGSACSASDASHFENLNDALARGGSLAEVTGFAQHPTQAGTLLASIGVNGSAGVDETSSPGSWVQLSRAQGGAPLLDPGDPSNRYISLGGGVSLKLCALGSACKPSDYAAPATVGAANLGGDSVLPQAPVLLDPAATANLLAGTCRVWRGPASSGALWTSTNALSPAFDGAGVPCTATSALVRSIAAGGPVARSADAAHTGSDVLYAGLDGRTGRGGSIGGHVFVTTSAHTASGSTPWSDISRNPVSNDNSNGGVFNPFRFAVTSIFVDAHDPGGGTVYVTVAGTGSPHLYRSLDFGAHWINLTANLPDAPLNSVVVDPNDANTVYVGGAAGLYVAQTIGDCSSLNCWSLFGTGLPNASVTKMEAAALLPTGDGRRGMLRAATSGRGLWQVPLLGAIAIAEPALTPSPSSLSFADQQVATRSAAQRIVLTSSGTSPVTINMVTTTPDFVADSGCTNVTLAVGSTCAMEIRFAPTAAGTRSGALTVQANVAGGQITVALAGVGTAPADITLSPLVLTFPATVVNQISAAQNITVTNNGGSAASLGPPAVSGDFSISTTTCGASLPARASCSVAVVFAPSGSGVRQGSFSLTGSAGTQTATLSGMGSAPATDTLSATSLSFAQQTVGSAGAPQQLILTNAGDVPLTLISTQVSTSEFTATNGCGASLAPRSSCAISVSFVPAAPGTRAAVLLVTDQSRQQAVTLSGIGVAPAGVTLSPATLSFAAAGVGTSGVPQSITLTNNGGSPLLITSTSISSDFTLASTTCGTVLSAGTACTFAVVFTPSTGGARSGTLTLVDNAPPGTHSVALSGTGIDFTFAASGSSAASVRSGGTATYVLLLNSIAGLTGNFAVACTGAPAHSACNVSPATPALGANTVVTVTVQTGLSSAALHPWKGPSAGVTGVLLAFLAAPIGLLRRRKLPRSIVVVGFSVLAITAGCGKPRLIPDSGLPAVPTPTPSGTYTLSVSATAAGLTRTVPLTLVIQ